MIKNIFKLIIGAVLVFSLAGCQTEKISVAVPNISMKSISQNSAWNYNTFEFKLPEDWLSGTKDEFTIIACPMDVENMGYIDEFESLPLTLSIKSYYIDGLNKNKDAKIIYENLFNGEYDDYKRKINQGFYYLKNLDTEAEQPVSYIDYLNLISDVENESYNGEEYIKDFQCKHYKGTYGNITEVQYTCTDDNNNDYYVIEYYREDIPYVVTGTFSDDLELSSGDIALWVADSLKVDAHFTVKDGEIHIKN